MMNEYPNRPVAPDDEFDIEVLAGKLWRINKKIWGKLFSPVLVLLSRPKRLMIILAISIAVAVILRFTLPASYKSGFIIKPNNSGDGYFMGMLYDLDLMLKDKNYPAIAKCLDVNEATAEKLLKVEFTPIYKNEESNDTINAVEVRLLMRDATLIDTFQNSIIYNYLENNPYYSKAKELRKKEQMAMEEHLYNDLRENDSLKKVLTHNTLPRGNGGFVFGEPIDPVKVYESGLALFQRYIAVRSQKDYNASFELVKPGIVRIRPYFPRMIILLPVMVGLGLIVCLVMNYREPEK